MLCYDPSAMAHETERYATPGEVRALRTEKGLTLKEAAELCGVHWTSVQKWELGKVERIRRAYLDRLAKARPKKR
jgi:transcriptional regulator with XRE-family HTH domain